MSIGKITLFLMNGFWITLVTVICSSIIALILSFLVGMLRTSRHSFVKITTGIYVGFFRGSSLLVQLFWLYYVMPFFGIRLSALVTSILAISLNYGAYGSEVVKSTIESIPKAQTEASIALNFTPFQKLRRIILPQAFVMMLPSFGNLQVELIKATSLVSLITLADFSYYATVLNNRTMQTTQIYIILLVIYFLFSRPFTMGIKYCEKKLSVWRG